MKFLKAENDYRTGLTCRLVSENSLIEIGVHRVLFGWRVRAGFVNSEGCDLDWCAGGKWKDVERLYSICLAILSKRDENHQCFDGIPNHSNIKPFYLDPDFVLTVLKEAGDFELLELKNELDEKTS